MKKRKFCQVEGCKNKANKKVQGLILCKECQKFYSKDLLEMGKEGGQK